MSYKALLLGKDELNVEILHSEFHALYREHLMLLEELARLNGSGLRDVTAAVGSGHSTGKVTGEMLTLGGLPLGKLLGAFTPGSVARFSGQVHGLAVADEAAGCPLSVDVVESTEIERDLPDGPAASDIVGVQVRLIVPGRVGSKRMSRTRAGKDPRRSEAARPSPRSMGGRLNQSSMTIITRSSADLGSSADVRAQLDARLSGSRDVMLSRRVPHIPSLLASYAVSSPAVNVQKAPVPRIFDAVGSSPSTTANVAESTSPSNVLFCGLRLEGKGMEARRQKAAQMEQEREQAMRNAKKQQTTENTPGSKHYTVEQLQAMSDKELKSILLMLGGKLAAGRDSLITQILEIQRKAHEQEEAAAAASSTDAANGGAGGKGGMLMTKDMFRAARLARSANPAASAAADANGGITLAAMKSAAAASSTASPSATASAGSANAAASKKPDDLFVPQHGEFEEHGLPKWKSDEEAQEFANQITWKTVRKLDDAEKLAKLSALLAESGMGGASDVNSLAALLSSATGSKPVASATPAPQASSAKDSKKAGKEDKKAAVAAKSKEAKDAKDAKKSAAKTKDKEPPAAAPSSNQASSKTVQSGTVTFVIGGGKK